MGHVYEGLSELFNYLAAILGLGHQHVVVDDRMRQRVVERALSDQDLMVKRIYEMLIESWNVQ